MQVEVADATTFIIPDTVGTIFMYNPFWGMAMDGFMQNVLNSFNRSPREITVVFVNAARFEAERYPWLKTTDSFSTFYPHYDRGMQVDLFTVVGADVSVPHSVEDKASHTLPVEPANQFGRHALRADMSRF